MYRCALCGKVAEPGKPCNLVVVEKRERDYPEREWMPRRSKDKKRYKKERHRFHDRGGEGWEIAKEVKACDECCRTHEAPPDRTMASPLER